MRAVPFDLERLEVTGAPVPIVEGVHTNFLGLLNAVVAGNGTFLYVPANVDRSEIVVSVDREGRVSALPGIVRGAYRDLAVSPDGQRLAVAMQGDIWIYDFERTNLTRLTTDRRGDRRPLWTPDGQRVLFTTLRSGYPEIFWRPADGTGSDERLFTIGKGSIDLYATGWSPDGARVLFTEGVGTFPSTYQCTIGQFVVTRPSDVSRLVKGEPCTGNGTISRDGRWIAYQSNVSGRYEIYVERYPQLGNRQQVSTDGGRLPVWSRDGRELLFRSLDDQQVIAVPVQTGATPLLGRARMLFEFPAAASLLGTQAYDVTPDGRFLAISPQSAENASSNLVLVQNFFEELKRLVPTN
jgi:serine/threonine-protein kinase